MPRRTNTPAGQVPTAGAPDQTDDQDPAVAQPAPSAALKRFRVELPFQPSHEFDAVDQFHAIGLYREWAGIISTDHQYLVHELTATGEVVVAGGNAEPAEETLNLPMS